MKKTPSLFLRDWSGNKDLVTREPNPVCAWVFAGEGVPTVKKDGTCCMMRGGKLYKRREIKAGQTAPPDFESLGDDPETGKIMGWVPVGDGPDDRYHREAMSNCPDQPDGTYELIGPKIQGNPERHERHVLFPHGFEVAVGVGRTFDEISEYLRTHNMEGIVWHHPDGRMAKIKTRDFGHNRPWLAVVE